MRRREFLAGAGSAALLLGMPRLPRRAPRKLHVMDTWFWESDMPIPEQAALAQKLGYAGMAVCAGREPAERLKAARENGLEMPAAYLPVEIQDKKFEQKLEGFLKEVAECKGLLWLNFTDQGRKPSDRRGDKWAMVVAHKAADMCKAAGMAGVAFYPHAWCWLEKTSDAVRLAKLADRPDVGAGFNQYHWMVSEGGADLRKILEKAKPHLKTVSINGSDRKASILPLGEGAYDVFPILEALRDLSYEGPVLHQGYGIKGDVPRRLEAAKAKWDEWNRQLEEKPK